MNIESARKSKSRVQLRTQRFPDALFLEDGILLRAVVDWRDQPSMGGDLEGRQAIERKIRGKIRQMVEEHNQALIAQDLELRSTSEEDLQSDDLNVWQDDMPLPEYARLEFVQYREVHGIPGYDWFVCSDQDCERLFHINKALKSKFRCPLHSRPLSQLAHLFVHNVCGHIAMIEAEKCWNEGCGSEMRLHLHPPDMRRSYWWCPECKKRGIPDRSKKLASGWSPGWKRDLFKFCPVCKARSITKAHLRELQRLGEEAYDSEQIDEASGDRIRMALTTARTAFKPASLTTVDMPGADENVLLATWFQEDSDPGAVRASLPVYLREQFDSDPKFRQTILKAKSLETGSGERPSIGLSGTVRDALRDYAGAQSTPQQSLENVKPDLASHLLRTFGIRVRILDGLAVINATFGYLKGSNDPSQAQLNIFHMGGDRYAALTERLQTEAILFELEPSSVFEWLGKRGHTIPRYMSDSQEQSLRRYLLTQPDTSGSLQDITRMAHTMSHLLIRTSERVTGVSRDNLQEIVWPRTLAFVLYNSSGSDLGMLQTAFEGSMYDWLHGARHDAANCPYDPVCRTSVIAPGACHACLYVAERNCNEFWNRQLGRQHLITFDDGPVGYWGRSV
ncbi:MAG TPA: DUF1998 domain-containing protein [Chloroflexia bacterium]|jgi:hypothetical protein